MVYPGNRHSLVSGDGTKARLLFLEKGLPGQECNMPYFFLGGADPQETDILGVQIETKGSPSP